MRQLFVPSKYNSNSFPGYTKNSCLKYAVKHDKCSYIANMNDRRVAACTVFEGRIVVTGGVYDMRILKSVEPHEHH